eukprot:gene10149-13652_t
MLQSYVKPWIKSIKASFELKDRGTNIYLEIYCGYIQFISCCYVLPVVPSQLHIAGYNTTSSIEVVALTTAIGCIVASYICNLPFIIAPPTSVSIYLGVALRNRNMTVEQGNVAVIASGIVLVLIGFCKPISKVITKLIPDCIQASTATGIGLITALAGVIELKLVVGGQYTLLAMGPLTSDIIIAIISLVIIAVSLHFHIKGSFIFGLLFGTITWWIWNNKFPHVVTTIPTLSSSPFINIFSLIVTNYDIFELLCSLSFLYIITLNGIARSLSDLAELTNIDGSIPRGNWLFIICGLATILSGYFNGPPILISPESAAGIKAGARTGLSTLICGFFFAISLFFGPLFATVPPSGTSPLLLLVGMLLFINVGRIKWNVYGDSIPSFIIILLIPFTYSILSGVLSGYLLYVLIGFSTGEIFGKFRLFLNSYSIQLDDLQSNWYGWYYGSMHDNESLYQINLNNLHKIENNDDISVTKDDSNYYHIESNDKNDRESVNSAVINNENISEVSESKSTKPNKRPSLERIKTNHLILSNNNSNKLNPHFNHSSRSEDNSNHLPLFLSIDEQEEDSKSNSDEYFRSDDINPILSRGNLHRLRTRPRRSSTVTRPRNGSLVDMIPMDMESGINSMIA